MFLTSISSISDVNFVNFWRQFCQFLTSILSIFFPSLFWRQLFVNSWRQLFSCDNSNTIKMRKVWNSNPDFILAGWREAWANDNILFVEGRVEEMDYVHIPPLGLIAQTISAPCCKIHSIARNPFYARLRKDNGTFLSERLRHWMIQESLRCVRIIVDCNSYFNAAYYIENPTGNEKVGLFIHGDPFWDLKRTVDYRLFDTSYCMWNSEGPRKHTSIMIGNHSNLQDFELRHKCLPKTNPCSYLRETRGKKHKRQVCFDDYVYDKNKVHPKELVQYLASILAV